MSDNPILDAYLGNVDREQRQKQQDFENDQAQKTLDMHMKMADETEKYHKADLGIRKVMLKQQMQKHFDDLYGNRQYTGDLPTPSAQPNGQMNESGTAQLPSLPQSAPSSNTPFQLPANAPGNDSETQSMFPGGFQVDPQTEQRSLLSQQNQNTVDAQAAGTKQAAMEVEKLKTAKAEQQQKHIDKIAELAAKNEHDQSLMNTHMGALTSMNNNTNASRIAAARIHAAATAQGLNPDMDEISRQGDLIMNGQEDDTRIPAKMKPLVHAYIHEKGGIVPDPKSVQALPNIMALERLFDRVQKEGPRYSNSTFSAANPWSDTSNFMNELASESGRLATTFDQQNRKSDQEIARQLKGLFNPKMSKEQNLENLQRKRQTINSLLQGSFHGMPADQLNELLSTNGIESFGGFGHGNGDKVLNYKVKGKIIPVHPTQVEDFKTAHPDAELVDQ